MKPVHSRRFAIPHYDRAMAPIRTGCQLGFMAAKHMGHSLSDTCQGSYLASELASKIIPEADEFLQHEIHAMYEYDRHDRQVFTLSAIMQEMFLNTDLSKVKYDDLKMPFPCFYIQLEPGARNPVMTLPQPEKMIDMASIPSILEKASGDTKRRLKKCKAWHVAPLSGFYVNRFTYEDKDLISLVTVGFPDFYPRGVTPTHMATAERFLRSTYSRYFFHLNLGQTFQDGNTFKRGIQSILDQDDGNIQAKMAVANGPQAMRDLWDMNVRTLTLSAWRLLVALLFYLNSEQCDVITRNDRQRRQKAERARPKSQSKKLKKQENLKYLANANFNVVGTKQETEVRKAKGFSFEMPRTWRRGHMHRFWTGPVVIDCVRLPYEQWTDMNPATKKPYRKLIRKWVIPTIINPHKERELITNRFVLSDGEE